MKLLKTDIFTRLFFIMLLFIMSPVLSIFLLISIIQSIAQHTHGKAIESLLIISKSLLRLLIDIVEYITYLKHKPPFPFSPWVH